MYIFSIKEPFFAVFYVFLTKKILFSLKKE